MEILGRHEAADHSDESIRTVVVHKALQILFSVHTAFVAPDNDAGQASQIVEVPDDPALEDAKRRRMLHALLDLISLEGIYPSLSAGVGIPLQQRVISVLPPGVIAQQQQKPAHGTLQDEALLDSIVQTLMNIVLDDRPSIQPIVRGRILSDIISAASELAFHSQSLPKDKTDRYRKGLETVIDEYVLVALFVGCIY